LKTKNEFSLRCQTLIEGQFFYQKGLFWGEIRGKRSFFDVKTENVKKLNAESIRLAAFAVRQTRFSKT
jgi:hypothetical protein